MQVSIPANPPSSNHHLPKFPYYQQPESNPGISYRDNFFSLIKKLLINAQNTTPTKNAKPLFVAQP